MTLVVRKRADLTLDAFRRVAWSGERLVLHADAVACMREARAAFERLLEDPDVYIYGVTSGYGQRADVRLSSRERREQAARPSHVVRTSFGEPLPERITRGIVFARLANFVEGHAAVSPSLAEGVAAMLEGVRRPPVPALGNGCPGEIQALSHLFIDLQQQTRLREKDALALVNGSPCASALVADAALAARQRWDTAAGVFALAWEAISAPLDHLDPALDDLWEDPHEASTLACLRELLEGAPEGQRRRYQAPVSWRIMPRVLGQALRAAAQAEEAASISLRAVSDNPVFLPPDAEHPHGRVVSTGGFHNARAYPTLDNLAAAWADAALLCDRQLTKLLDGRVSQLPDQLVTGPGVYLGCLGFAAAGYAEHARHAAQRTFLPGSEGGGFGQNDVSAPTFLAWRKTVEAGRCLDAGLALLAMVASQAFFVTGHEPPRRLRALLETVRAIAPPMTQPRALGPEAEDLQRHFTARAFQGCTVEDPSPAA